MPLKTLFTEKMGISHPIALAPMGGSAGGALAAAVSNGGGLGLVGAGREDRAWVERELAVVTGMTDKPWGVGFQSWSASKDVVAAALTFRPHAVMLSFGDPSALAQIVVDAGIPLILQVTDLDEAEQALTLGANLIVAQGTEAGGHSGRRATLPFVPIVVDLAAPTPVLAAGGIADGRGVAAALALGAAGALLGTRFRSPPKRLLLQRSPSPSSRAGARTPSAAAFSISPDAVPRGPSATRPGHFGTPSLINGAAGSASSMPTTRRKPSFGKRPTGATCPPFPCGQARRST